MGGGGGGRNGYISISVDLTVSSPCHHFNIKFPYGWLHGTHLYNVQFKKIAMSPPPPTKGIRNSRGGEEEEEEEDGGGGGLKG